MEQRFRTRTFEEFRGSFASIFCAAKKSPSFVFESTSVAFSALRRAENFFTSLIRFKFLAMDDFLAI
jgi:hypothetical protein